MYKGNFNVQLSHAPRSKNVLPSAAEALVTPKSREQDVKRLEAMQASRPLRPPTGSRRQPTADSR